MGIISHPLMAAAQPPLKVPRVGILVAARNRLPAIAVFRQTTEAGFLMAYGPDVADLHRRAAAYVDKVLRGARAGDLPFERPSKFELVINARTARALGLTIRPSLLLRANQVLE